MLSKNSLDLILSFEIGDTTGAYYNKFLAKPTWPGVASGVTIGVGYDLGYQTHNVFKSDWSSYIKNNDLVRLSGCLIVTGYKAKQLIPKLSNIIIPIDAALKVFNNVTIDKFYKFTCSVFPGVEELHPDCIGALVSLVYNRGTSLAGKKRSEMRDIVKYVNDKNYDGIAESLISMKRLWPETPGLQRRRQAEADLIKKINN